MRTSPRFVTPNDFENYTGKNLNALLRETDNASNTANLFLMKVEDELLTRLDTISFRTRDFNELTEYQLENLQKAIIAQAEYIYRNSDLFTDSGYDLEKGEIISSAKLYDLEMCRIARDYLINSGLLNHVIKNRKRWSNLY